MAEIRWTKEAQTWLKDIHDYIALDNTKAAGQIVEEILERVQILKRLPEVGYKYDRYPDLNIRILLYGHYRIAYLIKKDHSIDILGVFHGSLDIDRYIQR